MNIINTIHTIMKMRGYTNQTLSEKLGFKSPAAISNKLYRSKKGMTVNGLIEMAEAMDFEIVVRSKLKDRTEFTLTLEDEAGDELK